MVSEGLLDADDLEDALAVIADDLDMPARLVRVVEVIEVISHPLVFSARSYPSKHRISPRNWC